MTDDEIKQVRALCESMGDGFANYIDGTGRAAHELKLIVPRLIDEVERLNKIRIAWDAGAHDLSVRLKALDDEVERMRPVYEAALKARFDNGEWNHDFVAAVDDALAKESRRHLCVATTR